MKFNYIIQNQGDCIFHGFIFPEAKLWKIKNVMFLKEWQLFRDYFFQYLR
jgi:hypothetical protein